MSCSQFIQTKEKMKVKDVVNLSQYCIHDRLITVIGEHHLNKTRHVLDSISIDDYILERIKRNKNIKILLEYCEIVDPLKVGSININLVYKKLQDTRHLDKIIPFDNRLYFLKENQDLLYNTPYFNYKNDEIYFKFLQPYFTLAQQMFYIDEKLYSKSAITYLYAYLRNIENRLGYLIQDLQLPQTKKVYKTYEMIRYELQANWGSVADFYILKELLKNNDDNVTEYIILVGDKHRENIQKVFDKFDKIIQNKGDTYQTYVNSKSSSSSSKK